MKKVLRLLVALAALASTMVAVGNAHAQQGHAAAPSACSMKYMA